MICLMNEENVMETSLKVEVEVACCNVYRTLVLFVFIKSRQQLRE